MKYLILLTFFLTCSAYAEIDKIIVYKQEREMLLLENGNVIKRFPIRLSLANYNPLFKPGPKRLRGDHQTPVGSYKIVKKRTNTNFKKSLLINYPNAEDIKWGKIHGHSLKELGDLILIHGEMVKPGKEIVEFAKKFGISEDNVDYWAKNYFYPFFDWTNGCIAVNEFEMDEIFELISPGTTIEIHVSRERGMDRNMNYHSPMQ